MSLLAVHRCVTSTVVRKKAPPPHQQHRTRRGGAASQRDKRPFRNKKLSEVLKGRNKIAQDKVGRATRATPQSWVGPLLIPPPPVSVHKKAWDTRPQKPSQDQPNRDSPRGRKPRPDPKPKHHHPKDHRRCQTTQHEQPNRMGRPHRSPFLRERLRSRSK